MIKIWDFIKNLIIYCDDQGVSRHAKALTFSTILALIPFLILLFSSLASSPWIAQARDQLNSILINNFVPEQIKEAFFNYFTIILNQAKHIKTLGIIFLLITIFILLKDIEDSFNDLTTVKNEKKHWSKRAFSILSLLSIPLVILGFVALLNWLLYKSSVSFQEFLNILESNVFNIKLFMAFFLWMWYFFIYKILPHKKLKNKNIMCGASCATFLIISAQQLFGLYLTSFSTISMVYGALSIIPIFLLWIYLNWQITLYCLAASFFYDSFLNSRQPDTTQSQPSEEEG